MERNKIDKRPESLRQYNNLHLAFRIVYIFISIACTSNSISWLLFGFYFFSGQHQCGKCVLWFWKNFFVCFCFHFLHWNSVPKIQHKNNKGNMNTHAAGHFHFRLSLNVQASLKIHSLTETEKKTGPDSGSNENSVQVPTGFYRFRIGSLHFY